MRVFIAAVVALACLVGAVGLAVGISKYALDQSEQALCPIVRLVLQHPVPYPKDPGANPSRVAAWQSYEDFVTVSHEYRCG